MKIKVNQLSKTYHQGKNIVEALKSCSFEIQSGEQIAITGSSGSGKSTLLHLLGGLEQATTGSVQYDKVDFSKISQNDCDIFRLENIGIVFQAYNLLPELTVRENVLLPLMLQKKKVDEKYFQRIIHQLNLRECLEYLPGQLSGGQQQRVAIARALIHRPECLLCDEPTGNLDKKNTQTVIQLLSELVKEFSVTLVMVTHDENIAKKFPRVITISDGMVGGDV